MFSYWHLGFAVISIFAIHVNCAQPRIAIAILRSEKINGSVLFTETDKGVRVTGNITGHPAGAYGFHIHESGDVTTCYTTGAHFDLEGNTHGGRDHEVRHTGDLGNVVFAANATAVIDFEDQGISLRGANNILGRALVLHEEEDDLGLTDHPSSQTTGNAGGRAACGVIGIHPPLEAWINSAVAAGPSAMLLLLAISLYSFIYKC